MGKFLRLSNGVPRSFDESAGSSTTIFGTRASPRSIVAATGITTGASHMSDSALSQIVYLEGSITGDSIAATISAGTVDGQTLSLRGRNNLKTVSLDSTTTNVSLNGPVTLGEDSEITLKWDTVNWVDASRN